MKPLRQNTYRRPVYKSGSLLMIGPATLRYATLTLVAVFSLLFLVQSAQGADRAIEIRANEQQGQALDQEMQTLEVNASRWQSLTALDGAATEQGMVPIGDSAQTLELNP